ncbi:MAG TPA: MgtC/SapB family protein [Saprospiraceae bacterium]|nr:MgtC/SapB family protein [Saprospiraceae bacterium]
MDQYIIHTPDFQITQLEFMTRLLVACGIGLLIGLEREHAALLQKESTFAGIRTFTVLSIAGFLGACLYYTLGPWVFAVVLLSVVMLTAISYWVTASKGNIGGTAEITTIVVVLLGAMTFLGFVEISLMITVILIVLLSSKLKLRAVIGKITQEEMYDFIRFVVAALLIFPFLPNEFYGPLHVINPREIGWVILLTSGLGFIGYVLTRLLGPHRGILLSGILGGLVSSTAVAWVFSKKSKEQPTLSAHCAIAILAASSIMFIRVEILVFVFNNTLWQSLAWPLSILFVIALGLTTWFFLQERNHSKVDAEIPLGRPLHLRTAALFGLFFMVILVVVAYAKEFFGDKGIYVASGIAGLSEVDAVTISVSQLAKDTMNADVAGKAILLASIANTFVKMVISLWNGSQEIRRYIYLGFGIVLLAAMAAFLMR